MTDDQLQNDRGPGGTADEDLFTTLNRLGVKSYIDQYGVTHYVTPNGSSAGGGLPLGSNNAGVPPLGTLPNVGPSGALAGGGGGAGGFSWASLISRYLIPGAAQAVEDILRQKNEEANRALSQENERMRLALQQSGMDPNRQTMFQANDVGRLERMGQPPPNYGPPAGSPYGSYISPSRSPTLSDTYLNTIRNAQRRISKGEGTAPDYTQPGQAPPPPADLSQPWTAPPAAPSSSPTPPPLPPTAPEPPATPPSTSSLNTPTPSAFLASSTPGTLTDPNDPNALSLARLLARYSRSA